MELLSHLDSLFVPFGAVLLVLMCGVVGYESLCCLGYKKSKPGSDLVLVTPWVSIIFGSVIIGLILFVASMLGQLSEPVIRGLLVAQIILALVRRGFWVAMADAFTCFCKILCQTSLWTRATVAMAGLILALFLLLGLSVPILPTIEADSATFYLNAANLYLQYNRIIDVGNVLSSMGRTGFLQLVYGMAIHSSNLAQAYLFLLSAVGMILLFVMLGRLTNYAISSLVLVVFATSSYALHPIILEAKFDGYTFALSVATTTLLILLARGERKLWTVVAIGLCAGFMSGITYNNLFVGGLFGICCIWMIVSKTSHLRGLLAAALLSAIVGSAPTYLQNIVLFENPVYPFAGNVFGNGLGKNIPEDSYNYYYMHSMMSNNVARSVKEVLELPVRLFITDPDDLSFGQRAWVPGMSTQRDPWLGTLLLIAMAGGILSLLFIKIKPGVFAPVDKQNRLTTFVVLIIGFWLAYLFWSLNQHLFRYFSAGLPLAAFASGAVVFLAWSTLKKNWRTWLQSVCGILMISVMASMLFDWADTFSMRMKHVGDWFEYNKTEEGYIAENYNYCPNCKFGEAMIKLRPKLEEGEKVLSFATGLFYFGRHVKAFSGNGSATVPSPHAFKKSLSQFENWIEWEAHIIEQDFQYVVINPTFLYLTDNERPIIDGFLENRTPEFSVGTTLIFRLQ